MRHVPLAIVLASVMGGGAGCAAIHGLDEYTVGDRSSPDASKGVDTVPPPTIVESGARPTGCQNSRECTALAARAGTVGSKPPAPAVCVKATGKCESLVTEDCPRVYGDYTSDDAVVVGTLLSDVEASPLEHAAVMAVEEIDAPGGGLPPAIGVAGAPARPLVVVGCSVSGDVLRATRHLAEALRVPAIIGPRSGEQVIDVTQQISAKAGTLVMTPTALASAISNLADEDLTWRSTPSDAQRAKLVIEQIKDLETLLRATRSLTTVRLGILHPTNALGISARDAISSKLILNGRFLNDAANAANVSIDAYLAGSVDAQAAIATKYAVTVKPDIVFITSVEQVANFIVPLEQALTAARAVARPYYVLTDASRTQMLLDAAASTALPPDIRRRIRGVGMKPDASSSPVLQDFRSAFQARYGAAPSDPAAPFSYDAMYAIAYALAATSATTPSGSSVAHGLRMLAVGSAATVGAKGLGPVLHELASGTSVSLRGTFGLMQWDTSGDITGGTVEVWCVGGAAAPAFGSSGLTMDVQTQVVGGAFVQCQ